MSRYLITNLLLILFAIPALAGYPSLPYSYVDGQIARAAHVNANEAMLKNGFISGSYTGNFSDLKIGSTAVISSGKALTNITDVTMTGNLAVTGTVSIDGVDIESALTPICSIIPFYDFDNSVTPESTYWAYCDGSVVTFESIGTQTLPDLSNRYLVGFGTEGGGDNDSAAWATAEVGAASHQVDLSHTHGAGSYAGPSHSHGAGSYVGASHTHNVNIGSFTSGAGGAHSHGTGTLTTLFDGWSTSDNYIQWTTKGVSNYTSTRKFSATGGNVETTSETSSAGIEISGSTADESAHTHAVDPPNTTSTAGGTGAITGTSAASGTGSVTGTSASGGSATQSIQPRSIRIRYLMRIK